MSARDDGGRAFPRAGQVGEFAWVDQRGMTLRDYFAASALNGIIPTLVVATPGKLVAERAYTIADAMLAERARGGKP